MLVGPEAREIEHQRLVTPHQDVVRIRGDLVGQRLAPRRRLGPLQQEAGREDPLMVEPLEVNGLDTRQFVDRWHGWMMPCHDTTSRRLGGVRLPLILTLLAASLAACGEAAVSDAPD